MAINNERTNEANLDHRKFTTDLEIGLKKTATKLSGWFQFIGRNIMALETIEKGFVGSR